MYLTLPHSVISSYSQKGHDPFIVEFLLVNIDISWSSIAKELPVLTDSWLLLTYFPTFVFGDTLGRFGRKNVDNAVPIFLVPGRCAVHESGEVEHSFKYLRTQKRSGGRQ